MAANGNQRQEHCHRGHRLAGENRKPQTSGSRCRACECALSHAHNHLTRNGTVFTPEQVTAYADWKFSTLRVPADG